MEVKVFCDYLVGGGPPSADAHHLFCQGFDFTFFELASHFPVLGRLVELVRLSAFSQIVSSFAASLRSRSDDTSLKMLSRLEESDYDLGTASLGLVSRGGLSVGANVGKLGDTCADICAWGPQHSCRVIARIYRSIRQ